MLFLAVSWPKLMQNLDTSAAKFDMEINADETKILTNNGTLQRDITIEVGNSRPLQIPRCHNLR